MSETRWYADTDDRSNIFLTTEIINPLECLEFVKCPKAGAIVYFGGTTRDNFENKTVVLLSYEAHIGLALKTLKKIVDECFTIFSEELHKVAIVHKLGEVPIMQESIVVAVSTSHRQQGWKAGEWLLEKIKEKTEIWKKEKYNDGSANWKQNENSNVM